jgi:hypothetical protein
VAKRVQRYGADGTRERYFADDDSTDLQVSWWGVGAWGRVGLVGSCCGGSGCSGGVTVNKSGGGNRVTARRCAMQHRIINKIQNMDKA